jgi:3-hydroxyisobutyrate dehydrogenase-like beta-hydroxyacid dehydrogenase
VGESTAQRVGIVGLGRMGLPICTRLCAAGFDVAATDVREATRRPATAAGARWRASVAETVSAVDVVLTVLPGPVEVASIVDELTASAARGTLWIEMSTVSPPVAHLVTAAAGAAGVRALDAPLGGGPEAAAEGRLLSFVGAHPDDLDGARAVLGTLADRIVHVGPPGSGYAVKLLANSLWLGQAVAVAETLTLASRAGLDLERVREALDQSAVAGRFLTEEVPALLAGDDRTSFSLARCSEQLESVLALGDELAVPLELITVVSGIHRRALAHYGDVDGELLGARFVAERAGVSFAPSPATDVNVPPATGPSA